MDFQTIVITAVSAAFGAVGRYVWGKVKAKWEKDQRQHDLMSIKLEAMDYGLQNVNHGFGPEYAKARDNKMMELKAEYEFVNKQ